MKKEEKATAIAELTEKFGRARLAILTECAGMPVSQMTELRRQLRGAKAEYCVVKNTLAVRASVGTTLADAKEHFKGPTGLVIGYDDPVLPAKILRDFIQAEKRSEKMKVTVGVLEGRLVQAADLQRRQAEQLAPRETAYAAALGQVAVERGAHAQRQRHARGDLAGRGVIVDHEEPKAGRRPLDDVVSLVMTAPPAPRW